MVEAFIVQGGGWQGGVSHKPAERTGVRPGRVPLAAPLAPSGRGVSLDALTVRWPCHPAQFMLR